MLQLCGSSVEKQILWGNYSAFLQMVRFVFKERLLVEKLKPWLSFVKKICLLIRSLTGCFNEWRHFV